MQNVSSQVSLAILFAKCNWFDMREKFKKNLNETKRRSLSADSDIQCLLSCFEILSSASRLRSIPVRRKEKQCQEEEAKAKPRKDANATFDHVCVEGELPKKVSHYVGGEEEALAFIFIVRKDKVRKKKATASQGKS